jgi:type II secretory pathway pseudopilin PulG
MGMTLFTRRFAAWIACFAILLAVLAPSISQAVANAKQESSSGWAEICSVAGIRFVQVDAGAVDEKSAGKAMQMEHCAFCSTHAGSVGLPPASPVMPLLVASGTAIFPALYYQSPAPLFIWSTAQSRAPPALN